MSLQDVQFRWWCRQRADHVSKKATMCKPRRGASEETKAADTLILNFYPPGLWENDFCTYFPLLVLCGSCPSKPMHNLQGLSLIPCSLSLGPMTLGDTLLLLICLLDLLCGVRDSALSPTIDHVLFISTVITGPNSEPCKWQILKKPL